MRSNLLVRQKCLFLCTVKHAMQANTFRCGRTTAGLLLDTSLPLNSVISDVSILLQNSHRLPLHNLRRRSGLAIYPDLVVMNLYIFLIDENGLPPLYMAHLITISSVIESRSNLFTLVTANSVLMSPM